MYTVYLATRNSPESSHAASTLRHAKEIANNFLLESPKGRVRIEGPSGGAVFEYPEEKIVDQRLKHWLETAAAKDKARLLAQLEEVAAKPWKARHR